MTSRQLQIERAISQLHTIFSRPLGVSCTCRWGQRVYYVTATGESRHRWSRSDRRKTQKTTEGSSINLGSIFQQNNLGAIKDIGSKFGAKVGIHFLNPDDGEENQETHSGDRQVQQLNAKRKQWHQVRIVTRGVITIAVFGGILHE
ncbi:uncharacterized protein LOC134266541, partial [Saccostrea cucullata]|uniref:uncharacterized protein LOC134266541 n=1 Tax=Saccostrea cuccullata TaxID=36930 RepID=UPI002ECFEE79